MNRLLLFALFFCALKLASQNENDHLGNQYLTLSDKFLKAAAYDSAYKYSKAAFKMFQFAKTDSLLIESALIALTSKYRSTSNDSIQFFELAKKAALNTEDWRRLMDLYYTQADILNRSDNKNAALKFCLKVDSISRTYNHFSASTVKALIRRSEISRMVFTKESSKRSYDLLHEALVQAKSLNSQELIHLTYVYLCDVSGLVGEVEEAKKYIDLGLAYYVKEDIPKHAARLYLIATSYYKATDSLEKAKEAFLKNIEYSKRIKDKRRWPEAITYYGIFQGAYLGDCESALKTNQEALDIYKTLLPEDRETDLYQRLIRELGYCHLDLKNYESAANYFKEAYRLKMKLVRNANRKLSRDAETKYETEKKEQEIALLKSQNQLEKQQKVNQRNLLVAGLLLTTLLGTLFYFLFYSRKKANEKLRELDKFKSQFFANISHEFRTPLTLISGPLEKRLQDDSLSTDERNELLMMKSNSSRLLNLVDQLLDLSKLESGHLKLKVKKGNITQLLKSIVSSFEHIAVKKNIIYNSTVQDIDEVWFDKDVVEKVVINLLSNAFKYSPQQREVSFKAHVIDNQLEIKVTNAGIPLTKGEIERIFDRFYQSDENAQGVGIGLSLVKELLTLSHGGIKVENVAPNKIAFIATLPISQNHYKDIEIFDGVHLNEEMSISTKVEENDVIDVEAIILDSEIPLLLIVEDNSDLRAFIKTSFQDQYQVIEAINGKDGIDKAIKHIPDIIISDIMMPETDGLELSKTLKQDERTSHIPIILLTAKVEAEDQFKGLETGADDYITKPFKTKLLDQKIKNLIHSREILRKRYSQEVVLKPKDIAISDVDQIFLEKIENVLDAHLTNPDFNTEKFGEAVGMSRMQLYRKLKALTGLTATEFVRSQRLILATTLLQEKNINVSEIAYAVGFNDPSYFSRCFKEVYACTPKEYAQKRKGSH
ncbi:response regulator [Winogradskyella sp.]|uniref:response regulator n=1 Tax=Winogradskyella sp. TaxID=1883156 RepID=UPI003BA9EE4D